MIEFSGELYGEAKLFFLKKVVKKLQFLYIFILTCLAPLFLIFAYRIGSLRVWWIYPLGVLALCLFCRILLKKGNKDMLIQRVYVEDKYIFSVTPKEKYRFKISSVKKVIDYGEFYFIGFSPFLPVSDIVCQKNLLSQGALEDFESLFECGIIRQM